MPAKNWLVRIEDMLAASEKILRYTGELADLEAFTEDEKTVDAVIRNILTIGEAARHIPDDVQKRYPNIEWGGMRGMRNILVHDYAGVVPDVVWGVVERRIPGLILSLREILEAEQGAPTDPDG
jgi:uncharacterized protein with HEPN domain